MTSNREIHCGIVVILANINIYRRRRNGLRIMRKPIAIYAQARSLSRVGGSRHHLGVCVSGSTFLHLLGRCPKLDHLVSIVMRSALTMSAPVNPSEGERQLTLPSSVPVYLSTVRVLLRLSVKWSATPSQPTPWLDLINFIVRKAENFPRYRIQFSPSITWTCLVLWFPVATRRGRVFLSIFVTHI